MCDRGVSVELLAELVHEHELGGLTTREVVESFVLPQTYDYGCSLAGLMKRSFPARVGAATHYVVHSWDCNFARLVEMLASVDAAFAAPEVPASATPDALRARGRARPRPRALFWLDVAAVDQHRHVAGYGDEERVWLHRDELLQTVRTCIEAIPVTVVFMEPAARPLLLRRTWCLYEVMQALSYSRELILSTCPSPLLDVTKPMAAAVADVASAVKAFKPDIEASAASSEADKAWLLRAVSAAHPSGAAWLNEQVGQVLLHWLAQEVLSEMQQADAPPAPVAALRALAALLELLGNIDLAHKQFVNALQAARDQLGTHHTLTLALTHDLACLQAKHLQLFGEAEELLRAALAGRQELLGAEHDDTLETALALARLLQADSRTEEAEALFRRALSGSLLRNGPAHRLTLVAANLLALLLQAKGALPEAHVLLSRTLATGLKTLGSKHLDVLVWRNNMAVLLQDARDLRRAEALFRKTLTDSEQALGTAHPQTLNVVFNLGQCLWQQGKLRPAEMLFRRELAGCQAIYGYKQRETLRSIRNLIDFLAAEGRAHEAEEYEDLLEQIIGEDESEEEEEDEDDAAGALGAALGGAVLGGGAGGSGGAAGALGLSRSGDDDSDDSSGSGSDGIGELRDESVDESGAPTQLT